MKCVVSSFANGDRVWQVQIVSETYLFVLYFIGRRRRWCHDQLQASVPSVLGHVPWRGSLFVRLLRPKVHQGEERWPGPGDGSARRPKAEAFQHLRSSPSGSIFVFRLVFVKIFSRTYDRGCHGWCAHNNFYCEQGPY